MLESTSTSPKLPAESHSADTLELIGNLEQALGSFDNPTGIIDMDSLPGVLSAAMTKLRELESLELSLNQLRANHAELRDDYQARIAAMLKSIAVASRKRDALPSAVDTVEQMSCLGVTELVALYYRTCAQFRSVFNASFAFLNKPHTTNY